MEEDIWSEDHICQVSVLELSFIDIYFRHSRSIKSVICSEPQSSALSHCSNLRDLSKSSSGLIRVIADQVASAIDHVGVNGFQSRSGSLGSINSRRVKCRKGFLGPHGDESGRSQLHGSLTCQDRVCTQWAHDQFEVRASRSFTGQLAVSASK